MLLQASTDLDLVVEFTRNGWLGIKKKDEGGPGRVRLTPRRWRETASKVNPQKVKVIWIEKVNVGECCQELFDFISECINCTKLLIYEVIDDTDKNTVLSHHLSVSIKNLTRLKEIDIRDTNLSRGWREVLSSISSPHIRVLILWGDNLGGQGEVLEDLLTRLPQLRYLVLNDSGLGGEEILGVLYKLIAISPRLHFLGLDGLDLSKAGDRLLQLLSRVPKIRALSIENCKLQGTVISNILHQINTDIEVLCINDNEAVPDTALTSVFDHIKQCQSLQYLKVSSSQFTKTALSQLDSSLSAHGGHLLADASSGDKDDQAVGGWLTRISDECLND